METTARKEFNPNMRQRVPMEYVKRKFWVRAGDDNSVVWCKMCIYSAALLLMPFSKGRTYFQRSSFSRSHMFLRVEAEVYPRATRRTSMEMLKAQ